MDSTYLTELRQLNELNYARFEAKLEQSVAELRAEFNSGIAALRTEFNSKATEVQAEGSAGFAGLRAEYARTRLELLKWTVGLLVPTFLAIVGVLITVLRLR